MRPALYACLLLPLTAAAQSSSPSPPPASDPRLDTIGSAPSAARIEADVRKLVSFGTRHTLSDTTSQIRGIGAARRWIYEQFEQISRNCGGCLEVRYISGTISGEKRIPNPTEVVNVVAIQRGSADPGRYVIMSGDIDSRVSDVMNATADAPGANDDASGMAGTLEAARVLTQYKFPASIVYMGLSAEEQGLFGGKIVAAKAKQEGWRIEAMLNNDMIGNVTGISGVSDNHTARVFSEGTRAVETEAEARQRRFTGGELDSPSRNVARYIAQMSEHVPNLDVRLIYRLDRFGRGGHHSPFNDAGFPAVRVMEANENYDRQHQDLRTENSRVYGDTLDGVNFTYATKLTALNAVSLAGMAWAPPPPADVQIEGAVSADTTLKWTRPSAAQAPNLAGYKLYWRATTDAQWTHSLYVGNVDRHTLKNVVIDDFYFGVAAVARDGNESPVVFPGAAGSFGRY